MQKVGHQSTVLDVSTFYKAFLRICAIYIIVVKHIFILKNLYIMIVSWDSAFQKDVKSPGF